MEKEIKWGGVTTVPSDYESQDGTLMWSKNLLNEDGVGLRRLGKPAVECEIPAGMRVLMMHKVPTQTNWIAIRDNRLVWSERSEGLSSPTVMGGYTGVLRDIAAVGNTLVVTTGANIVYYLWKEGGYKYLGERPPLIPIQWGCKRFEFADTDSTELEVTTMDVGEDDWVKYNYLINGVWEKDESGAKAEPVNVDAERAALSDLCFGKITRLTGELLRKGAFTDTIFVRAAYRMYDQTWQWHTVPVMLQWSVWPAVTGIGCSNVDYDGASGTRERKVALAAKMNGAKVTYRVLGSEADIEALKDWGDIIKGIDVFFSEQIRAYDMSERIDLPAGISTNDLQKKIIGNLEELDPEGVKFYGPAADGGLGNTALCRQYSGTWEAYGSRDVRSFKKCMNLPIEEDYHNKIRRCGTFYKVAELLTDDLRFMPSVEELPLKNKNLTILASYPALPDDYISRSHLRADKITVYNSRLYLSQPERTLADTEPIGAVVANRQGDRASSPDNYGRGYLRVYARLNGETLTARRFEAYAADDGYLYCPRYVFYPEPTAFRMEMWRNGEGGLQMLWSVDLEEHETLNGAYYYQPTLANPEGVDSLMWPQASGEAPEGAVQWTRYNNKIYSSEVDNPWRFAASGVFTVGNGEVKALSTATQALSQGQFGQFPIYAFASDGVWAIEIDNEGKGVSVKPISRDVLTDASSILQLDGSVLFVTERGLMEIGGSSVKCISEAIGHDWQIEIGGIEYLEDFAGCEVEAIEPLRDFLRGGGMAYDYRRQRVYVFKEGRGTAWVLSLRSGQWGLTDRVRETMSYAVRSYPEALVVGRETDSGSVMYNLSKEEDAAWRGDSDSDAVMFSRPLKFGLPDALKRLRAVVQRGDVEREVDFEGWRRVDRIQSAVWGSRDLRRWHLIDSRRGRRIEGLGGSPYRWFMVGVRGRFDGRDSLSGCSVDFGV